MKQIMMLLAALVMTAAAARAQQALPPSAPNAEAALAKSTRHGEWIDITVDGDNIHTWVVHPERKEKAPVVIVIHEIYGLTDWIRSVADQLAAEGFIAVAPDLLSGMPDLPPAINHACPSSPARDTACEVAWASRLTFIHISDTIDSATRGGQD